ncbi:hypothetical protein D1822_15180 [Phaeobacter inhibens]|nr:hypothetical protein D1822_15180 [Phaeobacter inhibens]
MDLDFPLIHQRKRQHHNDAFRSAGHAVHDRRPKASWGFAFQAAQNRVHPSKASRMTIPIQQRIGAHLTTVIRARGV